MVKTLFWQTSKANFNYSIVTFSHSLTLVPLLDRSGAVYSILIGAICQSLLFIEHVHANDTENENVGMIMRRKPARTATRDLF